MLPKNSYSSICLSATSASPKDTGASIISVYKQKLKMFAMFETKFD